MIKKYTTEAKINNISACMDFIENELAGLKISRNESIQSILSAEEVLAAEIKHADENASITVTVSHFMGSTSIRIVCSGTKMDISDIEDSWLIYDSFEPEEARIVERFLEKTLFSRISYKRIRNLNIYVIKVETSRFKSLYITLTALLLGVLCGILLKNASADAAKIIADNIFSPVYTMFLNALKLIVGPLVFFSITESIASFSDIKSLGRIALKVFALYVMTSLIAIVIGFAISSAFPIGDTSLQGLVSDAGASTIEKGNQVSVSIKDTITGIIPADIINPFLKSDMLQIIFVAVMLGISTSLVDSEGTFASFIKSGNKVFSKFTAIVIGFLPVAVFCSMAKMMIGMNIKDLVKVIVWVPCCYAGHFSMMIVYGVLLFLFAKYNPFKFFKLFMPAILTGFSTASSNATLPVSLEQCKKALKISPKLYSFSIPMGATLNMDGNCVTLVITAMFGARIFGIDITPSMVVAIVVAIMSLSMGAPGVPGGNLVCAAILMPIIGVPAETISLIMGLYSLVGMSQVAANVTGDAVVTTIVAKSEGMIEA